MTEEPEHPHVPRIPGPILDPRPVVAVGTVAWAIGLVVAVLVAGPDHHLVRLCAVGVAVGALGYLVYVLQRRAVLRGSAGAQRGLDFDSAASGAADVDGTVGGTGSPRR